MRQEEMRRVHYEELAKKETEELIVQNDQPNIQEIEEKNSLKKVFKYIAIGSCIIFFLCLIWVIANA